MTLFESLRMTCLQATALAQKKEESKLLFSERAGLRLHLSFCSVCKLFFEQTSLIGREVALHHHELQYKPTDDMRKRMQQKWTIQLNNNNNNKN